MGIKKFIIALMFLSLPAMSAEDPAVIKAFKDQAAREMVEHKVDPALCETKVEESDEQGYLVSFGCKTLPYKCFWALHPKEVGRKILLGCEDNPGFDPKAQGARS